MYSTQRNDFKYFPVLEAGKCITEYNYHSNNIGNFLIVSNTSFATHNVFSKRYPSVINKLLHC